MANGKLNLHNRIIEDPARIAGKPVITGTRISVELVLEHLAHNPDLADLFGAYPHLTLDDVKAVLAYAHAAEERRWARARRKLAQARPVHA